MAGVHCLLAGVHRLLPAVLPGINWLLPQIDWLSVIPRLLASVHTLPQVHGGWYRLSWVQLT